jgi:DNA processing protein
VKRTLDLLTLSLLPGVGPRALRDLLGRSTSEAVLADPEAHVDLLGDAGLNLLKSGSARRRAEDEAERTEKAGFRLVRWDDESFPELLRRVYDPPPVLWVRGALVRQAAAVAVVGSRGASAAGRLCARALGRDLGASGVTVVSGLARGIDTAAHEGALDGQGLTIAVLGSGLDRMYPPENAALAARIAERGAVVSEFPLGTSPEPGHFPRRNRVIAGWSRAVVVVEAQMRSGALVTARMALDEGRDVLAVPGHPSQPMSAGTNQLIRDGAPLVRDAADVLAELGLSPATTSPHEAAGATRLLAALRKDAPSSLEELHSRCGRAIPEILGELAELELSAKVRRLPGGLFVRN